MVKKLRVLSDEDNDTLVDMIRGVANLSAH
jgi:hypothetical protein